MRRTALRLGLGFVLVGLAVFACRAKGEPERAWSAQLHVHGSFSEGRASLDSQSWNATQAGCDIVWWSDHDFRLTTFHHVGRFGFEGWDEPLQRGEGWDVLVPQLAGEKRLRFREQALPGTSAAFVEEPVREGAHSLRLEASSNGDELEGSWLELQGARQVHQRTLASELVLCLALWPEALPEDTHLSVKVLLSEHAPRGAASLRNALLRYDLSGEAAGEPRREGDVWRVPMRIEPGRWNELELRLSQDAVTGYPEFPGLDNALCRLSLGLETRRGARAVVFLDDLRLEQGLTGPPLFARQAELIGAVAGLYPGLTELQGLEVSLTGEHLNLFCVDPPLPDYAALARDLPRDPRAPDYVDERAFHAAVLDWTVRETHARGGLVSLNHAFGTEGVPVGDRPAPGDEGGAGGARITPEARATVFAELLASRASGADILEVGYRDRGGATLEDHLWLWDHLALGGLRLVGTGVSDSHSGLWRGTPNNFVSWIYAPAPDVPHLIEGLRAGRVFFGDLERFDGELDLVTDEGQRMGATVETRAERVGVELIGRGLRGGEEVVVIESGTPAARFPVQGETFRHHHELLLPKGPALVRFEVHDASGAIALTNPIWFLRPAGD